MLARFVSFTLSKVAGEYRVISPVAAAIVLVSFIPCFLGTIAF